MSKEIEDHIQRAFEIKQFLGSGAYGYVWKVVHKETGKEYALKKIFDAFQNDVDAQRTYRQVSILHQLDHQNIVKLEWVIKAHNGKDLYLVFQFMQTDLHLIIGEDILGETHILFILYQICKVLKYLHSAQLLHRDLKTSNILINSKCQIKICDFGLVRSLVYQEDSQLVLSQDVATRWYRSPQMLLGSKNYGTATDMWSVGCILAEMVIGEPIFPGNSNLNQLERILEFSGNPSKQTMKNLNCEASSIFLNQFKIKKRPFKHYFKSCSQTMRDLIQRMLNFDASKRITAEQVLQLPCLKQFRKSRETRCQKFINLDLDDNKRLDLEDYRRSIYQDIERRYPSFNRATPPMPKIYRSHHSCNVKDILDNSLVKKAPRSLYKINHSLHNSSSSIMKTYMTTTFTQTATTSLCATKKQPKNFVSLHKNNKENRNSPFKEKIVEEEKENLGTKIFKRKARRNLWKKQE